MLVKPTLNFLSQVQVEKVMNVIRDDPQIKSESFAWKVTRMDFYPMNYSWYDDVRLIIHGIKESSTNGGCGWSATVTIDLNTLTIVERKNTSIASYDKC